MSTRQPRSTEPEPEPVVPKAPAVPGGPVADMEAEGQGQSTSVPEPPEGQGHGKLVTDDPDPEPPAADR